MSLRTLEGKRQKRTYEYIKWKIHDDEVKGRKTRALYPRPKQNTQKIKQKELQRNVPILSVAIFSVASDQPTDAIYESVQYPQALYALRETSQSK